MSAFRKYIVSQFGKPRGFLGGIAGWIMARRTSNRLRNQWTVDLLGISQTDHVLEIGFGPGLSLQAAARKATDGLIVGVDHSSAMKRMATKRNRKSIRDGRMKLLVGSAENLNELLDPSWGQFDSVFAVNVAAFWPDPVRIMMKIDSLLNVGGQLALTLQPRGKNANNQHSVETGERLCRQMTEAGFENVRAEFLRDVTPLAVCVLGRKPKRVVLWTKAPG